MAALTGLLLASLALSAGQTALSASGSAKAAKAARKQGEYEGGMFDQAAQDAIARGEETAHHVGSDARLLEGAQRAAFAGSGVDVGSGSAADVAASDQRRAMLDEHQARINAAREAFGFTEQGRLARMGGRNQAAAYRNQMTSTLLGGAADLFSKYRAFGMNRAPTYQPATGDLGPTSVGVQVRGLT